MSWTIRLSILPPTLLLAWSAADAGEQAYVCSVEHVYDVSEYGKLVESKLHSKMEGARFAVSRLDGKILGEVLATPEAKSTRVLDRGSATLSFRATADFGDRLQSLEVREQRVGESKPFVASTMDATGIVAGTCR